MDRAKRLKGKIRGKNVILRGRIEWKMYSGCREREGKKVTFFHLRKASQKRLFSQSNFPRSSAKRRASATLAKWVPRRRNKLHFPMGGKEREGKVSRCCKKLSHVDKTTEKSLPRRQKKLHLHFSANGSWHFPPLSIFLAGYTFFLFLTSGRLSFRRSSHSHSQKKYKIELCQKAGFSSYGSSFFEEARALNFAVKYGAKFRGKIEPLYFTRKWKASLF